MPYVRGNDTLSLSCTGNNQGYAIITYDLAISLKEYSIQALQTSTFDKLIILLGNFHLELKFFGAVEIFLTDSGIEYFITKANVLAEGSLAGFMKGNAITYVPQFIKFLLLLWNESSSLSTSN